MPDLPSSRDVSSHFTTVTQSPTPERFPMAAVVAVYGCAEDGSSIVKVACPYCGRAHMHLRKPTELVRRAPCVASGADRYWIGPIPDGTHPRNATGGLQGPGTAPMLQG